MKKTRTVISNIFFAILLGSTSPMSMAQQDSRTEASLRLEARVMARLNLAAEYYSSGRVGAALRELISAQDIHNDFAPLQNMLGVVNMDLNRFEEAESAFARALRLDRDNPEIHNNYGWFLCVRGQHSKGKEWLQRAWSNPLYVTPEKALFNAGKCARMQNDTMAATEYFSKALTISPQSTAIMFELARMQFDQQNYKAVLDVIERIHAIERPSPQSIWLALRTEHRLGNQAEIESYGHQLTRRFPNSPEATLWLSRAL